MTCKVLEHGTVAEHFGYSLGGGLYVSRDEKDNVTICQHPAGDVRATPSSAVTLSDKQWAEAFKGASRVPEHRAVIEERKRVAAERAAKALERRAAAKAKATKPKRSKPRSRPATRAVEPLENTESL